MYHHVKKLMFTVCVDEPDVRFGNMLLEQFGGANGELAAAMQYSIQGLNCEDPDRKDLLMDIGTEELRHRVGRSSDRTRIIGIWIGRSSDRTRTGRPTLRIQPEYNGDQAIDDRMLPSCPRSLLQGWGLPLPLTHVGPGTPYARILPQEVGNIWDSKTPYPCRLSPYRYNNPRVFSSAQIPRILRPLT